MNLEKLIEQCDRHTYEALVDEYYDSCYDMSWTEFLMLQLKRAA